MKITGSNDVTKCGVRIFAITPNNSVDIPEPPRAFRCSGAGTVTLTLVEDDSNHTGVAITVAANETIDLSPRRIYSTGTTATGIVGFG